MVFVFILGEMRKHFWSDSVSRLVWFSNRRIFWEERNDRNISVTNETTNSWGETVLWPNGKMNVTASLMMTLGQQSESLGGFLVTLKWLLERLYVLLYEICKTDVLWPGTLDKNLFVHWTVTALQTLSWTLKSDISFSQKTGWKVESSDHKISFFGSVHKDWATGWCSFYSYSWYQTPFSVSFCLCPVLVPFNFSQSFFFISILLCLPLSRRSHTSSFRS